MRNIFNALLLLSFIPLNGQSITWQNEIANTIYTKCTNCHRTGGIAPFTLESYEEVAIRRFSIESNVSSLVMPPWPPDNTYSLLGHNRSLSDLQKSNLLNWLNNGMPRGDISKEPSVPVFPKNGDIPGTADLSLSAPLFNIHAPSDIYQCFVIKNPNTVDKFIQGLEVIPGNRNAVHHVLVFYDKTGQAKMLDDATAEPGYVSFGGIGVNNADLIGAWVPGTVPNQYPKGMGVKLPANGDIVVQVHYPSSSDGQMDQTMLRIFYSKETQPRQVFISPLLNHSTSLTNGPLIIPANTVKTFNASYTINTLKYSLLSVAPHMHLIGKSIEVNAEKPGNQIVNLIRINDWNFHWQGTYSFPKPIVLSSGTKLLSKATYDNTINNFNNPNSPPKTVSLGEKTTDEMMLVYFSFVVYQNGDENIILDSTSITSTKNLVENKTDKLKITNSSRIYKIEIDESLLGSFLNIYDLNGQVISRRKMTGTSTEISMENINPGIIFFQVVKDDLSYCKKELVK